MNRRFKITRPGELSDTVIWISETLNPLRYIQDYYLDNFLTSRSHTKLEVEFPHLNSDQLLIVELKLSRWLK